MKNKWIKFDSLASTSSHLSELLKLESLDEGTVVIADYQETGRGLGEHSWHSNRGENVLMSMLLFPAFLSASSQFHLSRVASLALCDALNKLGIDSMIKWPNDILGAGGKIAGILIEHGIKGGTIDHTIVGVGLNLNQTVFPSFPVPASSVRLEGGRTVDVTEAGELVEECLLSWYHELKEGKGRKLEHEYLDRLYKAGVPAQFSTGEGTFEGIIQGVNGYGELLVAAGGEIRAYGHGSIRLELDFKET